MRDWQGPALSVIAETMEAGSQNKLDEILVGGVKQNCID